MLSFMNSLYLSCLCLCLPEEILQTHVAHWWSPDGLRLAYMTINDTLVPKMEVPFFTGASYPNTLEYHYPKVPAATPVSLCVLVVHGSHRATKTTGKHEAFGVSAEIQKDISDFLIGWGGKPCGAPVRGEPQRAPAHGGDEETR